MKKYKKGFSLAEILLCLAIIGLVSAFGATIAKKSAQNAYNKFWRTGYEYLYSAIASSYAENFFENSNEGFSVRLCNSLIKKFTERDRCDLNRTFSANNGISYRIDEYMGHGFVIFMTVPQATTRANQNGTATTAFLLTEAGAGFLIPLDVDGIENYVNLQDRVDLLPFYIDDNETGRIFRREDGTYQMGRENQNNNNNSNRIVPVSFKEAACRIYGPLTAFLRPQYSKTSTGTSSLWEGKDFGFNPQTSNVRNTLIIDCNGIQQDRQGSVIKQYVKK